MLSRQGDHPHQSSCAYPTGEELRPRPRLMNYILLQEAWIGYWDEAAFVGNQNESRASTPRARAFPGRSKSYEELIDTQLDVLKLADVPPFSKVKKNGMWRQEHKQTVPDSTRPTLETIPARSDSSIWVYRFSTKVGQVDREVFAIFGRTKKRHPIKGEYFEKYKFLLRDEKSYSEKYFLCVASPKSTVRKPRRDAAVQTVKQEDPFKGGAGLPSPSSENMEIVEISDDQDTGPTYDEEEEEDDPPIAFIHKRAPNGPSSNTNHPVSIPQRHGVDRGRSETVRPEFPPWQTHQQQSDAAATQFVHPSIEDSDAQEPFGTPVPAALSKRSFPNMLRAGLDDGPATGSATHAAQQQSNDAAISQPTTTTTITSDSGTPQKRRRDRENVHTSGGNQSMAPPPKKLLTKFTISSAASTGNAEMRQTRMQPPATEGPTPPPPPPRTSEASTDADMQDSERSDPPSGRSGDGVSAGSEPEGATAAAATAAVSDAPQQQQQQPERAASYETALPIRASPAVGHGPPAVRSSPPPPPVVPAQQRRILLDMLLKNGSDVAYSMDMTHCHTVQELFAEASAAIRDELETAGGGGSIRSMTFRLDRIAGMGLRPRVVYAGQAPGLRVLWMKLDECLSAVPERPELLVEVRVELAPPPGL